ncbi:MAG: YdeI/OmpD-associated family protein [Segetibacter sp.]|nr:YdeI/OmpD-associated family protein [Segetibacter sp.]
MSQQSLFEKLQITNEKNFLIQGLPSSIEKQFIKLSYSKNVTPLLKIKRIDFALVFAVSCNQLNGILKDVLPSLHPDGKLWVAFPKTTSKIVSDLNRDISWRVLTEKYFETVCEVTLDNVRSALKFKKCEQVAAKSIISETKVFEVKGVDFDKKLVVPPAELERIFTRHKKAREFFQNLSVTNQNEYVTWIEGAKREDTRHRRLEATLEKLLAGKKSPSEK